MIHLALALTDSAVSSKTKEYIKRLPSTVFDNLKHRRFFEALVRGQDIYTAADSSEVAVSELLEWYESDKYKIFKTIDADAQVLQVSAVLDEDNRRRISAHTKSFETEVLSGMGSYAACLAKLTKNIVALPTFQLDNGMTDGISDVLTDAYNHMGCSGEDLPLIHTPYEQLNNKLDGGFRPGEIVTISGKTGGGKTMLVQNMVRYWAKQGRKILYVSTEMSKRSLIERWMLQEAYHQNIPLSKHAILAPKNEEEYKIISHLANSIADWNIHFSIIKYEMRDIKFDMMRDDYEIVVVDHFHSLNGVDDIEKIKPILQDLKAYSETQGRRTLVVLLAQHKKEGTYGAKRAENPDPSMIRNSAQLIDISAHVLTLWDPDDVGVTKDLHILKTRSTGGEKLVQKFSWIKNRYIFEEKSYG